MHTGMAITSFLLLIISSNHMPLCSIHTIMRPLSSLVVSLRLFSFQVATTTAPCRNEAMTRHGLSCLRS